MNVEGHWNMSPVGESWGMAFCQISLRVKHVTVLNKAFDSLHTIHLSLSIINLDAFYNSASKKVFECLMIVL